MASIKVQCSHCGHEFYMDEYKRVSCPRCGRVVVGPKADQSSGACVIATACARAAGLGDDAPELALARAFRDDFLARSPGGPAFVTEYYEFAPRIVDAIDRLPDRDRVWRQLWRNFQEGLDLVRSGRPELALERGKHLFAELKQRYLGQPRGKGSA